ncbi:GNAT family N-acetyltransferase [Chitinophaga pendula]|uniref:GNAT family N-acetyltransferase n=1 Tax=Chitinophaga TaxID=79328 RepID=UPI000BAFD99A|nr:MULTISPECIES: GNAT family N-acetyltransferase [Chitinophaga]ASZ11841.1 hypothetical protein CK934_13180 [Chitinophaga sp. MD30]UCJ05132.1 GNAT family N-acetyltransferase [Chitinophaga pendula]
MKIRPYNANDKQACITVFKSNMPKYFGTAELPDFDKFLDDYLSRNTAPETEQYYVISLDDTVIGCGGYHIDRHKMEASLTWGMVDQQYHKQGIGKRLFVYRVMAIQEVCPACRIRLDTSQHVFPFFEKLGFVITGITTDGYGQGLDKYDMELKGTR